MTNFCLKFPDITRPSGTLRSPKHNTVHFIKTTWPSCVLSTTSLGMNKLQIAKCEFEAMLKMVLPDLPKAAGRHPSPHRRRNQDGDPVATIGYHKPLCFQNAGQMLTRQYRHRLHIPIFWISDIYLGRQCSSRHAVKIEQLDNVVDFVKLANAQESDPELEQI
ncbi:hypothetical protein EVAR_89301_1 [Eumeta japonica]|uniref:Uncharacterized protein n=1 Tax=Eumeta variegata TaxID=151549 RepID=A0A4C1SQ64_EUMVA|nr:hypothetical protein EVAR_89301_1 [Eumeta japonica]